MSSSDGRMNIKSSEARRLAGEPASLTGETITEAVTQALLEKLKIETADRALNPDVPQAADQRHGLT